jgi:hypothetical protein
VPECTADFELGANGNAVLVADPGSATAWNTKNSPSGNTVTYSNTHAYENLAGRYDNSAAPISSAWMSWSTAFGTQTDHYGRFYLYCTANPVTDPFVIVKDQDRANNSLRITTAGLVQAVNANGTQSCITTVAITTGAFVRIEYHWIHSATVGQWVIRLYNDPDSETFTEEVSSAANQNTGASLTQISFGLQGTSGAGPIWLDNIVAGVTDWPGPVPSVTPSVENLAPVIYGRGAA